jgi:hypothetical protein
MTKRVLTHLLILTTIVIWISFFHWGNPATISAVSIRYVTYIPGIALAVGVLIGHLFFGLRDPITWPDTLPSRVFPPDQK